MARVLVVDDEKGIRKTISLFLENSGYDVDTAEDAERALQQVNLNDYDIVITDILMPGSSGFELLEEIKDKNSEIKVILITGDPRIESATRAIRAGAYDFFGKPINKNELLMVVDRAFKTKVLEDENREYKRNLEELVGQRTESLYQVNKKLQDQIEEHDLAQQKYKDSAEQYKLWADTINDVIWVMDIYTLKLSYCSPAIVNISGYTAEEILDVPFEQSVTDKSMEHIASQIQEALREAETVENPKRTFEVNLVCKDGGTKWVEVCAQILRDDDGNPDRILGVSRDIFSRKEVERKLTDSNGLYNLFVENMNEGLIMLDANSNIQFTNPAMCKMLGYSKKEIVGKPVLHFLNGHDAETLKKHLDKRKSGFCGKYVMTWTGKDDKSITTYISPKAIFDDDNQFSGSFAIISSLSENDKAKKLLESERKQLLSIFDAIEEIVYVVDIETSNIIYLNAHAKKAFEATEGEKCFESIHGYDERCSFCKNTEIIGNNKGKPYRWEYCNKKSGRWYSCNDKAIRWPDGRTVKIQLAIDITEKRELAEELKQHKDNLEEMVSERTDELEITNLRLKQEITAHERTEEKLRHAVEIAESATVAKSDFLANMSHEIRTPMNGVIGMTTLLMQTDLDKDQMGYTEIIQKSSNVLLTLINDILDFSKIESGKLEIDNVEFDLRQIVEDIEDMLAFRAKEKGVDFLVDIDPDVPSLVIGDPGRLRQVIINLADNAIKFTKEGEITISVSLEMETAKKVKLRFTVTDTGIGIPKKLQPIVFDSFTQGDPSRTRKFGGTGLGLTITKKFVNLMGGKIGVESEPNKGASFCFTIGLEKQDIAVKSKKDLTLDISGEKVLILANNDKHSKWLKKLLDNWECDCSIIKDETNILMDLDKAIADNNPYTVAIINYSDDLSYVEMIAQKIKHAEKYKDLALVAMANLGQRGDAIKMQKVGFSAYITKPVKQSMLFECLVEIAESRNSNDTSGLKSKLITRYSLKEKKRYNKIKILLVEDNEINQMVAVGMVEKLGYRVDVSNNGQEAIEALQKVDYNLVLMDCRMPVLDGYETTKKIRNGDAGVINKDVPILAMTASTLESDKQKCLNAGMTDFLIKPVESKLLVNKIFEFLDI